MQKMYKIAVEYWKNKKKLWRKVNKVDIFVENYQKKLEKIVHSSQKV